MIESNLVTAITSYEKSRVEWGRAIGNNCIRNLINVANAEAGVMNTVP